MIQRSAADLADALAAGETTSLALTQAYLDRIAATDEAVHSFLHVDGEGALAQAAASDERRAAGRPASALDGVPVAVKDVLTTEGLPAQTILHILDTAHQLVSVSNGKLLLPVPLHLYPGSQFRPLLLFVRTIHSLFHFQETVVALDRLINGNLLRIPLHGQI